MNTEFKKKIFLHNVLTSELPLYKQTRNSLDRGEDMHTINKMLALSQVSLCMYLNNQSLSLRYREDTCYIWWHINHTEIPQSLI